MARLTLIACFFLTSNALALDELFNDAQLNIPAEVFQCRHRFVDWGRNQVEITSVENGHISSCTFSHTERRGTSFRSAIYLQHYTCSDGTAAYYATDWTGGGFQFRHIMAERHIRCD